MELSEGDYKFDPQLPPVTMGPYIISLDKRWKLDELQHFSKNYEQSYYAMYAIEALRSQSVIGSEAQSRIISQMSQYPWRGGFSTVHFYYGVKRIAGKARQPEIQRIQYASPGFIELSVIQEIALNLGAVVASVCASVRLINSTYNSIYKGLRDRQLNEISVERARLNLSKDQYDFLANSISEMSESLNLDEREKLIAASGNELRALKILLSIYRRIRAVSEYQNEQKIQLPAKFKNRDSSLNFDE